MNAFLLLIIAIMSEITGTTALKASEGFTRLGPAIIVVVAYAMSFYLLSQCLKHIPLGTAYAIWSGLGTAGTAIVGVMLWQESLDVGRIIGIGLIIFGVVVLQLS